MPRPPRRVELVVVDDEGVYRVGHVGQWLTAWIGALKDRRESVRLSLPLVAYYWNGASPQAYQVKAVSPAGAYIVTPDRWDMGTGLRLTIQYGSGCDGNRARTLQAVQSALRLADAPAISQGVR